MPLIQRYFSFWGLDPVLGSIPGPRCSTMPPELQTQNPYLAPRFKIASVAYEGNRAASEQ